MKGILRTFILVSLETRLKEVFDQLSLKPLLIFKTSMKFAVLMTEPGHSWMRYTGAHKVVRVTSVLGKSEIADIE
jgi:hypothetical protein